MKKTTMITRTVVATIVKPVFKAKFGEATSEIPMEEFTVTGDIGPVKACKIAKERDEVKNSMELYSENYYLECEVTSTEAKYELPLDLFVSYAEAYAVRVEANTAMNESLNN